MTTEHSRSNCNPQSGCCGPDFDNNLNSNKKRPIEIYVFIDPLCPNCWAVEPILKKLFVEYGHYLKIKFILACNLETWNLSQQKYKRLSSIEDLINIWEKTGSRSGMSCDGDLWLEDPIASPYIVSVAIKAAQMQGGHAGVRFLRKLRELLFLKKKNVAKEDVLIKCAEKSGLDVAEFSADLHSEGAAKALQCDIKTTKEMGVDHVPTFVFFNDRIEDEGVKVTGIYPYEVYIEVIKSLLGFTPKKKPPITIEQFLAHYKFVATKEVAVVFDMSKEEALKQLKKLMFQHIVEPIPVKYGTFWRYLK